MQRVGIKIRFRPPKRRTPQQRLKRRLYYRRNRIRILVKRRRYLRTHRTQLKLRKLFQRFKPAWYRKKKPKAPRHFKSRKFKVIVPKVHKMKVFHAPKYHTPRPKHS